MWALWGCDADASVGRPIATVRKARFLPAQPAAAGPERPVFETGWWTVVALLMAWAKVCLFNFSPFWFTAIGRWA